MKDTKGKFELNQSGVRAMLQSDMMMNAIRKVAEQYGEVTSTYVGINRVNVEIKKDEGVNFDD